MNQSNSRYRAANFARPVLSILVLIAMAATAIFVAAPVGSAQQIAVVMSIDDYQAESGTDPVQVLLEVDPLAQLDGVGLAGFLISIDYDPAVVTPLLSDDPAMAGQAICESLVAMFITCGPPNPNGQLVVQAFTAAVPGLTQDGPYVRLPFLTVAPGQSDLTITIVELVASSGVLLDGVAHSGSVTVTPPPTCFGQLVTINMNTGLPGTGTAGNDVILGTPGDDVIRGFGGDDVICAAGGNDQVFGDGGNDVMNGGVGDDVVEGNKGDDHVRGGQGNDLVRGGEGNDEVIGNHGNDVVLGNVGDDLVRGGPGVDDIRGGAGDDVLQGGEDNDLLRGDQGDDLLRGGAGDDVLRGGADIDQCISGGGTDAFFGCES